MNFTINQNDLLAEMNRLQGIVEAKSTIPVLSTVLLSLNGSGALHLSATNLDLSMQTTAAIGMISTPGAACLPAKKLLEIVKNWPKGAEMSFEFGDGTDRLLDGCRISSNDKSVRSKFKLSTLEKDAFPEIKEASGGWITLPAGLWQMFVSRTQYAITAEESRYTLQAAKCEISSGNLRLVSTDGHRLAFTESSIDVPPDFTADVLIPKKALIESAKLADGAKDIQFTVDKENLFWKVGERVLCSRTLGGQFPNYELVLPKATPNAAIVDREALMAGVRRVCLMADERSHCVKMTFRQETIEIAAQSSEAGEGADTVSAEYQGDEIVTGFNGSYVLDCLNAIQTASVRIGMKDGSSAVEFTPVGNEKGKYVAVVMPQRL